jgi:hypothetical protein
MSKRFSTKISNRNTELINLSEFDMSNIFYDAPTEHEIQQGNKTIKYYKVNIGATNKRGVGEFVFDIPEFCHSFGVEEFQNEQGKATNHSVSLSLIDMNNPTETQTNLVKDFSSFIEHVKEHILAIKKEIKKPTLEKSDLKKFNPMYQSVDEDGNPKGTAWYFSPKLMERKIYNKEDPSDMSLRVETKFFLDGQFDEKGEPVEVSPLEFLGKKHFKFRGAIKIESVYVGSKISLQCKIYDGVVRSVTNERRRLTNIRKDGQVEDDSLEILLDD